MAADYIWPATLPQMPQKGFSETSGVSLIRTPVELGPAKQRYRARRPDTLSVSYLLTDTQVTALETFVKDTIKGTARFYYTHPRTTNQVEARIVPQGDGQLYSLQYAAHNYYTVTLALEILP